jgi:hypothetical protein
LAIARLETVAAVEEPPFQTIAQRAAALQQEVAPNSSIGRNPSPEQNRRPPSFRTLAAIGTP